MNITYNTRHLSIEQKKELCRQAKDKCFHWHVDKLDCRISSMRQPIEMSFEAALDLLDSSCHFIIIWRLLETNGYLEVGFCTIAKDPDYFLWINCKEEHIDQLTEGLKICR